MFLSLINQRSNPIPFPRVHRTGRKHWDGGARSTAGTCRAEYPTLPLMDARAEEPWQRYASTLQPLQPAKCSLQPGKESHRSTGVTRGCDVEPKPRTGFGEAARLRALGAGERPATLGGARILPTLPERPAGEGEGHRGALRMRMRVRSGGASWQTCASLARSAFSCQPKCPIFLPHGGNNPTGLRNGRRN